MKKINRLKKSHDIASIVKQRKRITSSYYILYYQTNNTDICKIAISVSKKYGNAVERNYAKRVVREIVRCKLEQINKFYIVIVIKNQAKLEKYETLNKNLLQMLDYLDKRKIGGNK